MSYLKVKKYEKQKKQFSETFKTAVRLVNQPITMVLTVALKRRRFPLPNIPAASTSPSSSSSLSFHRS